MNVITLLKQIKVKKAFTVGLVLCFLNAAGERSRAFMENNR